MIRTSLTRPERSKKWKGTSLIEMEIGPERYVQALSNRTAGDDMDKPYQTGEKPEMIRNRPYQDRMRIGAIVTSLTKPDRQR